MSVWRGERRESTPRGRSLSVELFCGPAGPFPHNLADHLELIFADSGRGSGDRDGGDRGPVPVQQRGRHAVNAVEPFGPVDGEAPIANLFQFLTERPPGGDRRVGEPFEAEPAISASRSSSARNATIALPGAQL